MNLRKIVTMREALADPRYFGLLLVGDSWAAWRVLLIAIVGEQLTDDERIVFKALTGRPEEPGEPILEFWGVIGRRGGKSRAAGTLSAYLAGCCDWRQVLAPGERGILPVLAVNQVQAGQAFRFIKGVFEESPGVTPLVENVTADSISLATQVDIRVQAASFRSIRGISAIAAICDEISFWLNEGDSSRNADKEIVAALRPALATTGGPLIAISSPYAKRGELYGAFRKHYGPEGDPLVLVAHAPSRTMNPGLSQSVIDRAFADDPESARAEYEAVFRSDIAQFVAREVVEACVTRGVIVRPPLSSGSYRAFIDPSGGSSDSMTLAIAHRGDNRVVIDCVLEKRAPFHPDQTVGEFTGTLKHYRCATVTGDRYGGEWPRERFAAHGIRYAPAEMVRSELYLALLPLLNSGKVDLLDNPRLVSQLCGLERRTARSGKDSIDHAPGQHDDIANAVAGACVLVGAGVTSLNVSRETAAKFGAAMNDLGRRERAGQLRGFGRRAITHPWS